MNSGQAWEDIENEGQNWFCKKPHLIMRSQTLETLASKVKRHQKMIFFQILPMMHWFSQIFTRSEKIVRWGEY